MAMMTKPAIFKKEFAYWGEIGKWKGLLGVKWIFVRDLYFSDIGYMEENNTDISELKDGTSLSLNNALMLIDKLNKIKEKSDIFARFAHLDKKEKDIRAKAEAMIMTGMYDIYAKEHEEKKKQYLQQIGEKEEAKEEAPPVVVVKKKLTQGQLKKLKKQQDKSNA